MKTSRQDLLIYLSLSSLLWIYLGLRAAFVPMAHDEIATFHYYVQTADFLPFIAHWDMNNHVVNSALSALFYSVFGLSAFGLRLANLITFPLFCIFLWKTGNLVPNRIARWAFWTAFLLSHGFMEFFSLSRGYGMSMAFLMPALYYTLQATTGFTTLRMMAAMVWSIVATLANMTLLNTLLLLTGWMLLVVWFSGQVNGAVRKLINSLWLMLTGLTPAIFFAIISFKARELGLLYTGGSKGFFTDTVRTLVPKLTGFDSLAVYLICLSVCLFILLYAIRQILKTRSLFHPNLVFLFLLSLNILSYWLLNRFFHVNYPENRVALYLFPLFIGALCFAAGDLAAVTGRRWPFAILFPLLFFPVHFAYNVNLTHSEFYIEDPIPVSFYNAVKATHRPGDYPPTVGGHRLRHFCWSFSDFRNGGTESQVYYGDYPGHIEDFQVVDGSDLQKFETWYSVLLRYEPNDRLLLKRKTDVHRTLLVSEKITDTQQEVTDEYYTLFPGSLDTLAGKTIYIGFSGNIESPAVPFEAWIVAEARDSTGTAVCYEKLALNWLRPAWQGDASYLKNGILIANLPGNVKKLQVYLWNMKKAKFRVTNTTIEIYKESTSGRVD
jgi:hypothetical protein